ncbi:MAG: alginate export family protein, partial [Leptospira sp.]|nr:alginate export family protein [Leptospira sp.]
MTYNNMQRLKSQLQFFILIALLGGYQSVISQDKPATENTKPLVQEKLNPDAQKLQQQQDEDTKKKIAELEENLKKNQAAIEDLKKKTGIKKSESKSESASDDDSYLSPMKKNGIPAEHMRHQFLQPELAKSVSKSQKGWIGNVFRVGVNLRPRYEDRHNLTFNRTNTDNISRILQTSQVWFLVDPSPYITMKMTIQDSRVWGGSQPAATGDIRANFFDTAGTTTSPTTTTVVRPATDIREGYMHLQNFLGSAFKVQIGRQVLSYGDQRLLGGANWTANGLSYDGINFKYDAQNFSSHLFGVKMTAKDDGPNGVLSSSTKSGNSYLAGSYNTIKFDDFLIDLYALGVFKSPVQGVPLTGRVFNIPGAPLTTQDKSAQQDNLITSGFRITNRTAANFLPNGKNWDWTIESAWQFGSTGQRIAASWDYINQSLNGQPAYTQMQHYSGKFNVFQTGYTFFEKLRVGYQHFFASGDSNRTDASASTFQTISNPRFGIFPYWNNVGGMSENIGMKNVKSNMLSLSYKSDKWGELH